jgi:hypothetical protein
MGLIRRFLKNLHSRRWKGLAGQTLSLMRKEGKELFDLKTRIFRFQDNLFDLQEQKQPPGGANYVTRRDIEKVKAEAKKIFDEIKSLEAISKLESKKIIQLLKAERESKVSSWRELEEDISLQKQINQETLTLDHLFKKALVSIEIALSDPNRMRDKRSILRDLFGIITVAKKVIEEEKERISIEIKRRLAEMKDTNKRLDKLQK